MSEQVIRNTKVVNRSKTRNLVQVAMLGAVAGVLMNFEFPIPILAPPFYQMDFSEVPVLLGAFAMGPVAGVVIELIKVLLHFVLHGTMTAGVGELANFIFGCAFAVPAGLIYRYHNKKTRGRDECWNSAHHIYGLFYQRFFSVASLWQGFWNASQRVYRDGECRSWFREQFANLCGIDSGSV